MGVGGVGVLKLTEEMLGALFVNEVGCSCVGVSLGGRRWRREVIWVDRAGDGGFDETEVV